MRSYGGLIRQALPFPEQSLMWLEIMRAHDDASVPTPEQGDCHDGDLLFEADDSPSLLDWQSTFRGAPGHDHAELRFSSLTVEGRRTNKQEQIAHDRDVLVAHGFVDAPSFDPLFLSYHQNVMHIMGSSVMNPCNIQIQEVAHTTVDRSIQAALDVNMASALATFA